LDFIRYTYSIGRVHREGKEANKTEEDDDMTLLYSIYDNRLPEFMDTTGVFQCIYAMLARDPDNWDSFLGELLRRDMHGKTNGAT
jgi:hypothetical protein